MDVFVHVSDCVPIHVDGWIHVNAPFASFEDETNTSTKDLSSRNGHLFVFLNNVKLPMCLEMTYQWQEEKKDNYDEKDQNSNQNDVHDRDLDQDKHGERESMKGELFGMVIQIAKLQSPR